MADDLSRILSADPGDEVDLVVEGTLRPRTLDEYIGQREVKANLSVLLQAAKGRGEAADHILLYGPPGLGKTTLATIVARELGVNVRYTSGPAVERAGDLASVLTSLDDHDVLFIDEIHRLNRAVEEILYPAMEDYALDVMIGKGPIGAVTPPQPEAVHRRRRDHPGRADQRPAAGPVRRHLPARLLHRRRARGHRRPVGRHPGRRDRTGGHPRDRPARAGHAADRQPPAQARPRPRRGARRRPRGRDDRPRGDAGDGDRRRRASIRPTASCWPRSSRSSHRGRSASRRWPPCSPRRSRPSRTCTSRSSCASGFIDRTPQGRIATDLARAHLSGLGYEIPPPRRAEAGMPSLWDDPPGDVSPTVDA